MTPVISVIITNYNYGQYIIRAIDSVLGQTFQVFELIIIDDGSTDGSQKLICDYLDSLPTNKYRITFKCQENRGPNAARNTGIQSATGEYIAFLDADDEWMLNKLELQIVCAVQNPKVGIVGCSTIWVDSAGAVVRKASNVPLPEREQLCQLFKMHNLNIGGVSGVFIRRNCFMDVGYFDESLQGSEDRDMWLRICQHYDIVKIQDALVKIHIHGSNSHFKSKLMIRNRLKFIDKHFAVESIFFRYKAVSYAYLDAARDCYGRNRRMSMLYYSAVAILIYPFKLTTDDNKIALFIKSLLPACIAQSFSSKKED